MKSIKYILPCTILFSSIYANAATQIVETFKLVTDVQSKCLDIAGYAGGKDRNAQIWHCDGYNDQRWFITDLSHYPIPLSGLDIELEAHSLQGKYLIKNAKSGLCLDIEGYDGYSNDSAQLWNCDGYLDQEWSIELAYPDPTNRHYTQPLKFVNSSPAVIGERAVCLDVGGTSGASGNDVQLWNCRSPHTALGKDQIWYITEPLIMAVPDLN